MPSLPTGRPNAASDRSQLQHLRQTLTAGSPALTRRDLIRVSALTAGAVATARSGVRAAAAAPNRARVALPVRQEDAQTDQELLIPFNPFGQPITLDPHRTVNWGPFWVMFPNVWGGLLRYTETGAVEYDLAESYQVSDDGRTYTFRIRPDARFANGNPVLAEHFVQSWMRALNRDDLSPMADFMALVDGFDAYINRESDEIGFEAIDDQTVSITLSNSYSYFPSYLASFVWSVVDPSVIESVGEDEFVLNDAGTGPWRFTEFEADSQFVMEPNTEYYGGNSPSLARLVWTVVRGPSAEADALDLYQTEDAISADVTLSVLSRVQEDETLNSELVTVDLPGTTRSLAMDFTKEPFDNVLVRRAFAQATDRERYANEIYLETYRPTTSFTAPVVTELSGYEPPAGIEFNADDAAAALEEAGFPGGDGLPEIIFYEPAEDSPEEMDRFASFLATYQETLGVTITHDTSRTAEQIANLREDEGGLQIAIMDWSNIAETPYLLSYALRTDSPFMASWFNWNADLEDQGDYTPGADAAQFDELTAQADVELDEAARNDLYSQAEELALRNAVYIPIGNWIQMFVQKPWLQGTRQGTWTGRLPVLFDANVVVVGRETGD